MELFYEPLTCRYFKANLDKFAKINEQFKSGIISYNDLCYALFGIPEIEIGNNIRFNCPIRVRLIPYENEYHGKVYVVDINGRVQ